LRDEQGFTFGLFAIDARGLSLRAPRHAIRELRYEVSVALARINDSFDSRPALTISSI
jgi:hypothetical protein